jgi:ATP-dependent DNA helicase RecG
MLTDEELLALLGDLESDRVERTRSLKQDKVCQAICAFANDLPNHGKPGVLFIGVEDDGTRANLSITDELLLNLAHLRSDGNILPFPEMTVERKTLGGCELAVIQVQPSYSPPVRFDGRVWIRVGPRRAGATRDEERRLIEKRRASDLPFDQHPVRGSGVDDLNLQLFQSTYLPTAVAPDVLAVNDRSPIEQLSSLHFLTAEGIPNVAAHLTFGKDPTSWIAGAYVQFVRFDGTEVTAPIRSQKEITGPLPEMLRLLDEVLGAHISVESDVRSGVTEIRSPDYPSVALQQLARNAVLHRTYETSHAPARVYWFSDRIEIHSPGGLYGQVNAQNFGRPGVTDYRNPLLAEAMKVLGFVQRFGMGIPLARKELQSNGNPELELIASPSAVLATVRRRP